MLKGLGFDPGRTDGYFNEDTEKAVKAFQEEQEELEATGVIDKKTSAAIEAKIVDHIRDGNDDKQLEKALERSEEHTSELQSRFDLVCRLLLEKKKKEEK